MSKRKLTTAEILALARKQNSSGESETPAEPQATEPAAPAEEAPSAEEAPAEAAPAEQAKPAATPKSTKDILAAARAQKAAGGGGSSAAAESKPAAAGKPGARPKSTADILAAARAQAKGGGAAPAAKSKPAAKAAAKPASAKSATKAEGDRPSVEEMLKAVRGEGAPAAKPKPKLPSKPPLPKRKAERVTRRNFVLGLVATPFAAAWTAFTAAATFAALGVARFMLPNVLVEPPSKFKIGLPEDYPLGTVSTKWKSEFNVWITHVAYHGQPMIYALSTVCTHLGCTPNWLEGEQKFKCPCHGSGFYPDGVNFEGPAPRPLERYGIRLAPDGMLEVDKSVKFQEEMGQWADPASFYPTA